MAVRAKYMLGLAAAAMVSVAPAASMAGDGHAATVKSASGSVMVMRNGRLQPVKAGMRLVSGDKVVTRGDGAATVSGANGCSADVGNASMHTVAAAGCGTSVSLTRASSTLNGASGAVQEEAAAGAGTGATGGAIVIGVLAAAALGAGIYVAADEEDSGAPTSP